MAEGKSLYGSEPEEVFKGNYARHYRSDLDVIWGEVVQLNVYAFLAQKIVAFRSDLFQFKFNHFWEYSLDSLFDSTVEIIFKIAYDRGKRRFTLRAFAEKIKENLAEERYKAEFNSTLRNTDFDGKLGKFEDVIQAQRHSRIAHFNHDYNTKPERKDWEHRKKIFGNIPTIVDLVNSFFDALCISRHLEKTPFEYYTGRKSITEDDDRPDIDILLDWVAQNSPLLRMKEEQPDFWRDYRLGLKPEDIKEINRYRRKFGKPEV